MKNKRILFPALVDSSKEPLTPLLPTGHGAPVHPGPPRDRNLHLCPKLQPSCAPAQEHPSSRTSQLRPAASSAMAGLS